MDSPKVVVNPFLFDLTRPCLAAKQQSRANSM
jgi:hypothetical protein